MDLASQIESLLFFTGEPLTLRELSKMLKVSEGEIEGGLMRLRDRLTDRGITLVENGNEIMLRTAPEASDLILQIRKEELEKDLGKAGLETLAIILYQGPVTRARIDYIRGVNSAFIVRQLMVRGLIERGDNPADARSFLYKPTLELLSFLGLPSVDDLPDIQAIRNELASFESHEQGTITPPHAPTEPSHSTGTDTRGSEPTT
jgi:segregation and condensation protein B